MLIRTSGKTTLTLLLLALLESASHTAPAQDAPTPQPVPGTANLMRLEGVDPQSGIHYVKLMLSLPAIGSSNTAPPRFSIECTENKGKRDLAWLLTFGGVGTTPYLPPFRATEAQPFPPSNPNANLKMTFEGYMKWKPLTREWEVLPSGELRYRNPGLQSPNMDGPRTFLPYLSSLPGLRIGYAKPKGGDPPEVFFSTQPLLEEAKKTPACQP